jgi:hypothetical protein
MLALYCLSLFLASYLKPKIMNLLKLSTVIFFLVILSGATNQLQAQPEFATVRLVTTWSKYTVLFVTKGSGEIEEIELKQQHINRKQKDNFNSDNKTINSVFEALYADGFTLQSTSTSVSGGYSITGREIIYLLVKE